MVFEFDSKKSAANLKKHGIDFVQAQRLWEDRDRLQIPAKSTEEVRIIYIGKIERKHWTAVVTFRGERIRIISVRRARKKEAYLYES
jgi:uncharacterized protein